jgi:hypothetical protein
MARKKTTPKVEYIQVSQPDEVALNAVFSFLFDKFLEQQKTQTQ